MFGRYGREEQREDLRLEGYGLGANVRWPPDWEDNCWLAECETLDDNPDVRARDYRVREMIADFVGPHPSQDRWLPDSTGPSWGRRVARNVFGRRR